jgi:hypothetical protein
VRGWCGLGQKVKTEPSGLGFHERIAGGVLIWVVGCPLGWGKLRSRSWACAIRRCARGWWWLGQNQHQAFIAWFPQMNCGWACSRVEGTYMGWGKHELRRWGCPISCKKGEVGLVVLTCYLPIPIPFPTCFSAHQPPPSSHLHPIILPDVLGTGCVRSRWENE